MNNKVNENERWLIDGKCGLCRRQKYCSKPCKLNKIARKKILKETIKKQAESIKDSIQRETLNRIAKEIEEVKLG